MELTNMKDFFTEQLKDSWKKVFIVVAIIVVIGVMGKYLTI